MEELCKVLVWLFRYVSPDEMISSLDKTDKPYARPSYILSPDIVEKLYYTYDSQSDEADNKRKVAYLSDQTRFMLREEVGKKVGKKADWMCLICWRCLTDLFWVVYMKK